MSTTQSLAASGSTAADQPALDQAKDGPGSSAADSPEYGKSGLVDRVTTAILVHRARYRVHADAAVTKLKQLQEVIEEAGGVINPRDLEIDLACAEMRISMIRAAIAHRRLMTSTAGGRA